MALPYELDGHAHDDAERVQDNKRQVTNYCPLCEHYARSAEKLNDENRTLRQRVEELETHWKDFMQWDESAIMFDYKKRAEAAEAKLAAEREHHHHAHGPNCQAAEAEVERLREALGELVDREELNLKHAYTTCDFGDSTNADRGCIWCVARAALRGER